MKKFYSILILGLVGLAVVLFYRSIASPINVALIGNFEEERYNFETNSIIAARIAEKDINYKNGIRGKATRLIIRNDDFTNIEETVKFLKDNKVEAVITTATSNDLVKLKSKFDENKIVCLSVGATASTLSGQNDYIYRIFPDDKKEVKKLLEYLEANNTASEICIIYSSSNLEYKNSVERNIKEFGGKILFSESHSSNALEYVPGNIELMKGKPILIVASARETGIVLQRLKKYGIEGNNFGLSWSADYNLRSYGGRAAESFIFTNPIDFLGSDADCRHLTEELKKYNKDNGLIPSGIYKAYMVLKKAYEGRQDKHITLKEALDSIHEYEGLSFDEYGDSKEEQYIFTLEEGQFVKLGGKKNEN